MKTNTKVTCFQEFVKVSSCGILEQVYYLFRYASMKNESANTCALCNRDLAHPFNRHHLLPISEGGKGTTTILLHKICHDKIHAVFTEKELKRFYNSIERLQQHEDMEKFINWIKKKEPEFYDRSVKKKK